MTTPAEVKTWLERGKVEGATHVIVACDTFDHEDYPVFVKPTENVHEKFAALDGKNMQRVMEVYNLSMDIDAQLQQFRAFNF